MSTQDSLTQNRIPYRLADDTNWYALDHIRPESTQNEKKSKRKRERKRGKEGGRERLIEMPTTAIGGPRRPSKGRQGLRSSVVLDGPPPALPSPSLPSSLYSSLSFSLAPFSPSFRIERQNSIGWLSVQFSMS